MTIFLKFWIKSGSLLAHIFLYDFSFFFLVVVVVVIVIIINADVLFPALFPEGCISNTLLCQ